MLEFQKTHDPITILPNYSVTGKPNCESCGRKFAKKELARNRVRASSVEFVFYASLVAIVMMIPMVSVSPMPVPVVRGARGIAIVSIRSVVSVRVVAIAIRIAVVIAIPVARIAKSDSYAPDSD